MHLNVFPTTAQVPPFRQGLGEQGSVAVKMRNIHHIIWRLISQNRIIVHALSFHRSDRPRDCTVVYHFIVM